MNTAIAIVGMACRYPDAGSPQELWETVLTQRRAFRKLPPERLALGDYLSANPSTPDAIYAAEAALLEGYEFDRVRFRVAGSTFRSVDLTHWLALDVVDQALRDAGFPEGTGLPQDSTGVLVGNTLTGEFSRAALLRVRWPYVRRVVDARLRAERWGAERRRTFLESLEDLYKSPFPPVDEETLAGSLSNTIAGRICNHFHFGGGGYTLDGACSSSLLAVARACSALEAGEIDAALVGGVDLSLDPFELVGFSKAGALAHGEMRVYDQGSTGFLPGEGCGFVVLLRHDDALSRGLRSYGLIRGWGISSDGGGSITRPEMRGQQLALERAYRRAGYGPDSVGLFEGHGTGTPVGDEVELRALTAARRAANPQASPAAIGSVKANIGHTKAAAGVAGLIKAALALHHQLLPPTTGVRTPRPELQAEDAALRVLEEGEPWPADEPRRTGVSSFGFGGINVHVTMEGCGSPRLAALGPHEQRLLSTAQDAEVFLLEAEDRPGLARQVERLGDCASRLSRAEMADVAAGLVERQGAGPFRAGIVASTPEELESHLRVLADRLTAGLASHLDTEAGIFLGTGGPPRVAFLFPGQASPVRLRGGALARRFGVVRAVYDQAALPAFGDLLATALAQPAIVAATLAGLRLLESLGVQATQALGHSLGELAALAWAGALDEGALLTLAAARGRVMSDAPGATGAMASLAAGPDAVRELIGDGKDVVIACLNAPQQTVVSGECEGVLRVMSRARARGWAAHTLPTAYAFHSPFMAAARRPFNRELRTYRFGPLLRRVVSTVSGSPLEADLDLTELLTRQLTDPVRFAEALAHLVPHADLCLEVGPGQILSHLVRETAEVPVISLDVGGTSVRGVLMAAAAVFAMGGPLRARTLFEDRFTRPFDLDRRPCFLVNPCELAPHLDSSPDEGPGKSTPQTVPASPKSASPFRTVRPGPDSPVECVRALVAQRAELPLAAVNDESRLLRDLHLNSLAVGELVAQAAGQLGLPSPAAPLDFADATVAEVGEALERLLAAGVASAGEPEAVPTGVDRWVRAFAVRRAARPPRTAPPQTAGPKSWQVWSAPDHPLAGTLRERVLGWHGRGALVCLSVGRVEEQVRPLLEAARHILGANESDRRLVVLQPAAIAGSFARTLHLENPEITTCVIQAPIEERVLPWVDEEVRRATGHTEVIYDAAGRREEPCLELLPLGGDDDGARPPLKPGQLVLVSGGGRGIAAECARTLAREFGVALALFGRSRPEEGEELAVNLRRLSDEGVSFRYYSLDVTNPQAVGQAVSAAQEAFGPVAAILHGAGLNRPALLRDLNEADFERTLAPKLQGFRNLVDAVDPERLRLLVTFGSVIGRVGMRGEADYALANAGLTLLCEEFQASHPRCRCLALESSVWSDIGMGARLGRIEALRHEGITAMSAAEGTTLFLRLITRDLPPEPIVVSSRLGANPPLPLPATVLPLLRFVERPRVYYPGIELVVDADISTASDPYLREHVLKGQPLLPAVMGLEAMAQAAMAVLHEESFPVFEDVRFERPVVIEGDAPVTLRLAALVREPGQVEVVLRSSRTGFQVDHFRCHCRFGRQGNLEDSNPSAPAGPSRVSLDPRKELYGGLLFQEGRFQRLAGYRHLTASYACAEIAPGPEQPWFSEYLPSTRVLGDAAARDAALHSVQACVPHAVLLPVGVDRLVPGRLEEGEALVAHACERSRDGDSYVYDLEVRGNDGQLREQWQGLRLRRVMAAEGQRWPDALLPPFVEWRLRDLIPGSRVLVAMERDDASCPSLGSDRTIQRALGSPRTVRRRDDGRPHVDGDLEVSAAHSGDVTLAVASSGGVACDLEVVCPHPAPAWPDLLGPARWGLAEEIARQTDGDSHRAGARVWTVVECLKKVDAPWDVPLLLLSCQSDGWVCMGAPGATIATYVATLEQSAAPLALAVLVSHVTCATTNTATASVLKTPI